MASLRLADSLSAASAQYSSVKTAVGATPTPVHQQYLAEGQRRYYEAVGLAHDRYSEFLLAAKSAVGATPTPVHKSLANAASESIFGMYIFGVVLTLIWIAHLVVPILLGSWQWDLTYFLLLKSVL